MTFNPEWALVAISVAGVCFSAGVAFAAVREMGRVSRWRDTVIEKLATLSAHVAILLTRTGVNAPPDSHGDGLS